MVASCLSLQPSYVFDRLLGARASPPANAPLGAQSIITLALETFRASRSLRAGTPALPVTLRAVATER